MLSGAEEGAQGAPFESYKLAAVRLAEAVRLASRGNDSENDMVLELSSAVNLFLRESGIALAFQDALGDLEGVPNFALEFSETTTDDFAKDLLALPWISIRPYRYDECGAYIEKQQQDGYYRARHGLLCQDSRFLHAIGREEMWLLRHHARCQEGEIAPWTLGVHPRRFLDVHDRRRG